MLVGGQFAAVLPLGDEQYEDATDPTNISLQQQSFQTWYDPPGARVASVKPPHPGQPRVPVRRSDESQQLQPEPDGRRLLQATSRARTCSRRPGQPAGSGYYSFNIGTALHRAQLQRPLQLCVVSRRLCAGAVAEGDLAADTASARSAFWHAPRYNGGIAGPEPPSTTSGRPVRVGADVVLNGHEHRYETHAAAQGQLRRLARSRWHPPVRRRHGRHQPQRVRVANLPRQLRRRGEQHELRRPRADAARRQLRLALRLGAGRARLHGLRLR